MSTRETAGRAQFEPQTPSTPCRHPVRRRHLIATLISIRYHRRTLRRTLPSMVIMIRADSRPVSTTTTTRTHTLSGTHVLFPTIHNPQTSINSHTCTKTYQSHLMSQSMKPRHQAKTSATKMLNHMSTNSTNSTTARCGLNAHRILPLMIATSKRLWTLLLIHPIWKQTEWSSRRRGCMQRKLWLRQKLDDGGSESHG